VLGAAALGIGGYAYHEHEKHKKERAEEEVSSLFYFSDFPQLTIHQTHALPRDAQARTEGHDGRGSRGSPTWVLVDGRENIPDTAILAGRDRDNHPIYIARAYQGDSLRTLRWPCCCVLP
jgi:hypothetical protein